MKKFEFILKQLLNKILNSGNIKTKSWNGLDTLNFFVFPEFLFYFTTPKLASSYSLLFSRSSSRATVVIYKNLSLLGGLDGWLLPKGCVATEVLRHLHQRSHEGGPRQGSPVSPLISSAEPPLFWAAPAPDLRGPGADSGPVGSASALGKKGGSDTKICHSERWSYCICLYKLNWLRAYYKNSWSRLKKRSPALSSIRPKNSRLQRRPKIGDTAHFYRILRILRIARIIKIMTFIVFR